MMSNVQLFLTFENLVGLIVLAGCAAVIAGTLIYDKVKGLGKPGSYRGGVTLNDEYEKALREIRDIALSGDFNGMQVIDYVDAITNEVLEDT